MDIYQYNERVDAVLARSLRTEAFITLGAVATAALVACLPLALELQAGALAWVAAASLRALRRLRPGLRLRVDHGGAIEIGDDGGSIRKGSFVAPWLAVVHWRPQGAWLDRTVLVAPDMLPAEDFRRLRLLLRWGAAGESPAASGATP
jgi:hypothetical protein